MNRSLFVLSLAALLMAPVTPRVHAGHRSRRAGKRAQKRKARALYVRAEREYAVGKFQAALRLFTRAYETLPLPGFLFNIGQCHRMLGQCPRALFFYRGYLRKQPRAPNRALVRRLMTECTARRKVAPPPPRRVVPRRVPARVVPVGPPRRRPGYLPVPQRTDAPRPVPAYQRWWVWTLVGVGAAALATGLGVGLTARSGAVLPAGSLGTLDRR